MNTKLAMDEMDRIIAEVCEEFKKSQPEYVNGVCFLKDINGNVVAVLGKGAAEQLWEGIKKEANCNNHSPRQSPDHTP